MQTPVCFPATFPPPSRESHPNKVGSLLQQGEKVWVDTRVSAFCFHPPLWSPHPIMGSAPSKERVEMDASAPPPTFTPAGVPLLRDPSFGRKKVRVDTGVSACCFPLFQGSPSLQLDPCPTRRRWTLTPASLPQPSPHQGFPYSGIPAAARRKHGYRCSGKDKVC